MLSLQVAARWHEPRKTKISPLRGVLLATDQRRTSGVRHRARRLRLVRLLFTITLTDVMQGDLTMCLTLRITVFMGFAHRPEL
jgi:hypothetical protein